MRQGSRSGLSHETQHGASGETAVDETTAARDAEAPDPTQPPDPRRARYAAGWGSAVVVVVVVVWSLQGAGVSPGALAEGGEGARQLLRGFLTPDLSAGFLTEVARAVAQTVQISVAGLLFASIIGLPMAVLLAGNAGAPGVVRGAVRLAAAVLRGVPNLLWALLFVAMIGPGPAAGALAIAVHGAGMLAKLSAEQLEAVKPAPIEALRLTGASRSATVLLGVIPEARAGLVSLLLYQWECNIRTSTVLGFVGAGGIGQELAISLKLFRYDELSTLVLAVLALILVVDALSRVIRRYLGAAS